jgi:hypothetical protein
MRGIPPRMGNTSTQPPQWSAPSITSCSSPRSRSTPGGFSCCSKCPWVTKLVRAENVSSRKSSDRHPGQQSQERRRYFTDCVQFLGGWPISSCFAQKGAAKTLRMSYPKGRVLCGTMIPPTPRIAFSGPIFPTNCFRPTSQILNRKGVRRSPWQQMSRLSTT